MFILFVFRWNKSVLNWVSNTVDTQTDGCAVQAGAGKEGPAGVKAFVPHLGV